MENAIFAAAAIAVLLLGAALLVVWSRRDIPWIRGASILLAMVASTASVGVVTSTLGYAVPLINGITAPAGESPILAVKLILNRGIYITLDLPDVPKLFWLPWDNELAERLQEMMNDPDTSGVVMTVPPFEWSWDQSGPSFQPLPQLKWMPDKPPEPKKAPHFSA